MRQLKWRQVALAFITSIAILNTGNIGTARTTGSPALRLRGGIRTPEPRQSDAFFQASQASHFSVRGAVIQFDDIPSHMTRDALRAMGITIDRYVPDNAYLVSIPKSVTLSDLSNYGVRWVGELAVNDKLAEALNSGMTPEWCRDVTGLARFSIGLYAHIDLADASDWLATEYDAIILGQSSLSHVVEVGLPAENWADIAGDERVISVEPFWPRMICNNSNRSNTRASTAQAPPYNLSGTGITVGEWDEGRADGTHADLSAGVIYGDASSFSSHSTHVAGTVMGSGVTSGGTYRGMAPGAELVSYRWWGSSSELQSETQSAINTHDISISTNSWIVGYSPPTPSNCNAFLGNYFSECLTIDNIIRGNLGTPIVITWAAGNERQIHPQSCGSQGFTWGTVAPYGTSKNVITIGAINSNNSSMTDFSSWGPTDDGRLKPDVVAPGCQSNSDFGVTSTQLGGGYTTYCGTSMATPTTAGCVALWLERYQSIYPAQTPLSSTVKAFFIETADELGSTGPEFDFGYGRIDVVDAVDRLDDGTFLEDSIDHQDVLLYSFNYDGTPSSLSFTLVWDDPGAFAGSNPALINDLDLRLIEPGGAVTHLPWVLDPGNPGNDATTGIDHLNNVEQIRATGALPSGIWSLEVEGFNIPSGPQKFSLVYSSGITLTSGPLNYVIQMTQENDVQAVPGNLGFDIAFSNAGLLNDTYDVTLTSARGWTLTPDTTTLALDSDADSTLDFSLDIPMGTPAGTTDTISVMAVSQGDPTVSDAQQFVVSVVSGRAVDVLTLTKDTVGTQGHTASFDVLITNTGLFIDEIAWSVNDFEGWVLLPESDTVNLTPAGDTIVSINATIDGGATLGTEDLIVITAQSTFDGSANSNDFVRIRVIDYPPTPELILPNEGTLFGTATPQLSWGNGPYVPYPAEFDTFSYAVDIADDAGFTSGVIRVDGLSDSAETTPPLSDGTHYWRVIAFNMFGDSSGFSTVRSFETDTQAPDAPTLLSPPDDAYKADTTPTFSWNTVVAKGAASDVSYLWELSADSLFATVEDSIWTDQTVYTLPDSLGLDPCSTVVYWRVTALDDAGNWSVPSAAFAYTTFLPGDQNWDCNLDVFDVVLLVGYVFRNEPPPTPPELAELTCSGPPPDIFDVVALVDVVFRSGPLPCASP